jgi:hypothetical protein
MSHPHLLPLEQQLVEFQLMRLGPDAEPGLIAAYTAFLTLKLLRPSAQPSPRIDDAWHAHILCSRDYVAFCERHNGGVYVHHEPVGGTVRNYLATLALHRNLVGEPDARFWPPSITPYVGKEGAAALAIRDARKAAAAAAAAAAGAGAAAAAAASADSAAAAYYTGVSHA